MAYKIKKSVGSHIFDFCNHTFLILLALSIVFPFLTLLAQSLSAPGYASISGLSIIPKKFTLNNYSHVITNSYIWIGYYNTIFRTVFGTAATLVMSSVTAYCLSKKYFPNRTFWTFFVICTMFFGGGLIPTYLWMSTIGMVDNRLALILPSLISTYNMIIIRNYFMSLPGEIEESGKIDGASNIRILFTLIIPISKPILATVALWTIVGHWNAWFDCLVYMRDVNKFVLQIVLRRIVLEGTQQMMDKVQAQMDYQANPDAIKAATIFFTTLPILCIYPFMQKYFVKGIMIGSLKG